VHLQIIQPSPEDSGCVNSNKPPRKFVAFARLFSRQNFGCQNLFRTKTEMNCDNKT